MNIVKKYGLALVLSVGTLCFSNVTNARSPAEPVNRFHKKCGVYAARLVAKPDCAMAIGGGGGGGGLIPYPPPQPPVYHDSQVSQVTRKKHRPHLMLPVAFEPRPVWDMNTFSWVCKDPGNSACVSESGPKGKRYLHVYLDYTVRQYGGDYQNMWSCQPVTNRHYRKCRKMGGYPLWNNKKFKFHCEVPPPCEQGTALTIVNNEHFRCDPFGPLPPPIVDPVPIHQESSGSQ